MTTHLDFKKSFKNLTGNDPFQWQVRLYEDWFSKGRFPDFCSLPTGFGKTNVIAVWLIALANQLPDVGPSMRIPRRLIYVVDRRTVVDQATSIAENIETNLTSIGLPKDWVAISTLRGQRADNRKWSEDPSRPGIIIGTVDMIGSRLLFSGYRGTYKTRPLHAGLLGQDTLLVLDEAHLSKPFDKLITAISDQGKFQKDRDGSACGSPMKVIRMSATNTDDGKRKVFQLEGDFEKCTGDFADDEVRKRYRAPKRLAIQPPVEKKKLTQTLTDAAATLAEDNFRVVVFVRSPHEAMEIAEKLRAHARPPKNKTNPNPKGPYADAVEVLTGTMRGLERDKLLKKTVMTRFLAPDNRPTDGRAILVSTSAGEVGFDLNADHMVCDATTLDSMIQRLGRVNRRGNGNAIVQMFVEEIKKDAKPTDFEKAVAKTTELLTDQHDVSPQALADFKRNPQITPEQIVAASTPLPQMLELTDILLDAWSMTTIYKPMPGRLEVAPWLRGISDEPPQTTIAWRAELDLEGFDNLDIEDVEEWLNAHCILPHETLSVPVGEALNRMLARWKNFDEESRTAIGNRSCLIDRGGLQWMKLKDLIGEFQKKRTDAIRNAEIILPASFGGIERGQGLLDESAPHLLDDPTDERKAIHSKAPDVADAYGRHRVLRSTKDDSPSEQPLFAPLADVVETNFARFTLDLPSEGDISRQLISLVPKYERPEMGEMRQYLRDHDGKPGHVERVRHHMDKIIGALGLHAGDTIRRAAELAADWHDHGKDREPWQIAVERTQYSDGTWEPALAKSGGKMRRVAGGYRHEFGSLREFTATHDHTLEREVFDLAMHLIAVHHGRGRPHFPKGGFDPDARSQSPQIHTDAIRRFARLQRKYGHWRLAWLENLLRCADAVASAEKITEDTLK